MTSRLETEGAAATAGAATARAATLFSEDWRASGKLARLLS